MNCYCYREKIIEKLLNEWQVEMYATNLFLYKIPMEKIIAQRDIIKNMYDNLSFILK